jgi:hypothetical protein
MSQVTPDRLDRIERILEATATRLDQVAQQQETNTIAIGELSAEIKSFVATQEAIIENAETDRASFQAEIRRIWEYLLAQSGNGHTSG